MMLAIALLCSLALDTVFGEPRRWHPLVGFGLYATHVERLGNVARSKWISRLAGVCCWLLSVMPFVLLVWSVRNGLGAYAWSLDAVLLYFALGARSLGEHARAVARPLAAGDIVSARAALARIVSRDTQSLDASQVAAATVESVLENGNDAIFGALFWFALLGGPGALLFRLANTLDAMWGYRTSRYLHFGWAAARLDDVLNFIPARLTALSYALLGKAGQAMRCWQTQASAWDSPNAGPVMAAGAGALGVALGGPAIYHGVLEPRPQLGCGARPEPRDVIRAMQLVQRSVALWFAVLIPALLYAEYLHV